MSNECTPFFHLDVSPLYWVRVESMELFGTLNSHCWWESTLKEFSALLHFTRVHKIKMYSWNIHLCPQMQLLSIQDLIFIGPLKTGFCGQMLYSSTQSITWSLPMWCGKEMPLSIRWKMKGLNENLPVWNLILILWERASERLRESPATRMRNHILYEIWGQMKHPILKVKRLNENLSWEQRKNGWERWARNLSLALSHKIGIKFQTGKFSFNPFILFRNLARDSVRLERHLASYLDPKTSSQVCDKREYLK